MDASSANARDASPSRSAAEPSSSDSASRAAPAARRIRSAWRSRWRSVRRRSSSPGSGWTASTSRIWNSRRSSRSVAALARRLERLASLPRRRPLAGRGGGGLPLRVRLRERVEDLERRVGVGQLLLGALPVDRDEPVAEPRERAHRGGLVLDERAAAPVGGELAADDDPLVRIRQAGVGEDRARTPRRSRTRPRP